MSTKSAPYYWIECDHPACDAKSGDDAEYTAYADFGYAADDAVNNGWALGDGRPDMCSEHAPPFCADCSQFATTEHEERAYCDDCIAAVGEEAAS